MALTGSTNEEKIWNFFKNKGLTDCGVAGLMGNLYAESGLSPTNLQNTYEKKLGYTDDTYTAAVDNGSYANFVKDAAGYGLAQWTYWSRKQNLLNYVRSQSKSIGDLESQLEFLYKELSESYKSVLTALKAATSVLSASNTVLKDFEKPKDQGSAVQTKRASYGQAYYDKYAKVTSKTTSQEGSGHMISNCGHDENGKYTGGKAGDQTGGEWALINWYSRPWKCVLRYPDENVRNLIAQLAKEAAQNDKIGYDQGERNTFWTQLQKVGYYPSKITVVCEADCSSGVVAIIKAVGHLLGIKALQNVSATYTGNMRTGLKNAGFTVLTESKYLTSEEYLLPGDILLNDSCHVATNITKGSKASGGSSGTTTSSGSGNTTYSGKGVGTAVAKSTMYIRKGAGKSYDSYGTIAKGTAVEVLEVLSNGWYKIVWPAASCGYAYTSNSGNQYYTYTAKSTGSSSTSSKTEAAQSYDKGIVGKYKVTASSLFLRTGAGTNKTKICSMDNGSEVQCYGYYTSVDGVKWYYVVYDNKAGFCSSKYLKKQ